MKKFMFLAVILVAVFVIVGFKPAKAGGGASLEVQFTQSLNHVTFTVLWVTGGDPNSAWPFLFGDGTQYVLVGASGTETFSHDYESVMPGVVSTYYPQINLVGWTDPWQGTIIIDDRPPEVYTIFFPFVSKPFVEPQCSINVTEGQTNHIMFGVNCQNVSGGGWAHLEFDTLGHDSASTDLRLTNGVGFSDHTYPWPYSSFNSRLTVIGLDAKDYSFDIPVEIYWP